MNISILNLVKISYNIDYLKKNKMDEFLSTATGKGMFVVDSDGIEALTKEYDEVIVSVDEYCEKVDPETTPYASKYKARELLDKIGNQLEANRTVAMLEKKTKVFPQ